MGGNVSDNETETFSWCNNDELKIKKEPFDTHPALTAAAGGPYSGTAKASSSASSSSTLFQYFVGMGYPDKLVQKAIEENGEGDADSILNSLLTYAALASSPQTEQDAEIPPQIEQDTDFTQKLDDDSDQKVNTDSDEKSDPDYELWSSDSEDDSSDPDFRPGREGNSATLTDKEQKLLVLADMGYSVEEASVALDNCGSGSSIEELADFICASQMAKSEDTPHIDPSKQIVIYDNNHKKRKMEWEEVKVEYDNVKLEYQDEDEDEKWHSRLLYSDEPIRLPKPMIGFGIPADPNTTAIHRYLPDIATGPPYFYYENVALAPKGVWDTISRFLYEVEPEFVDSKYFCAAARKRGYIHNLPIQNRCPLLPLPPRTIQEVLPLTQRWWPRWDKRTKMNCLQTAIASAKLTERIRKALEEYDGDPPPHVQKYVLDECKKWNLVWVGRNKAAPLEPDEVEMLLGFPRNHTRGGGISRTDRYKSLGNSFQVDTVAYHLSVLKDIFHGGITVLSLFSGIGGAEVALHRLGIPLKAVVSVEKSRVNRDIVSSWWEQTNQKGILIDIEDVQLLTEDRLKQLMESLGGFDLVIGGSPCNNLAGSNRVSRDGLEGKESSLFFEYCRILDSVRRIMARK